MAVRYNKLWKLLIDKRMTKMQLGKKANVTTNVMAHLSKDEDVRVESLVRICGVLGCTIDDIMEIIPDNDVERFRKVPSAGLKSGGSH